jgi:hypothetical protein
LRANGHGCVGGGGGDGDDEDNRKTEVAGCKEREAGVGDTAVAVCTLLAVVQGGGDFFACGGGKVERRRGKRRRRRRRRRKRKHYLPEILCAARGAQARGRGSAAWQPESTVRRCS